MLITGYKGLIGSHLPLLGTKIDRGDKIPEKKFKRIIHLASNCVIREVIKNPDLAKENIDYTYQILEKARKDKSEIILFSSSRVGSGCSNTYIASKLFIEQMAEAYRDCYGLKYIIIRPETVWGKENNIRVINKWIGAVKNNNPVIVFGDEDKELPPIHAKDFVDIFMEINNNFDDYLYKTISIAGKPRKVGDLISCIGKHFNKTPKVIYKEPETSQPQKCRVADMVGEMSFEEQLCV